MKTIEVYSLWNMPFYSSTYAMQGLLLLYNSSAEMIYPYCVSFQTSFMQHSLRNKDLHICLLNRHTHKSLTLSLIKLMLNVV